MSTPVTCPTVLADIDAVFAADEDRLWTKTILTRLATTHPTAYGDWDAHRLASVLRGHGIRPRQLCATDAAGAVRNRRGYTREAITAARHAGEGQSTTRAGWLIAAPTLPAALTSRPVFGGTDRDNVRDALVELLTHGLHPDTGRPGVLADIGAERAHRTAGPPDPWGAPRTDLERLAELLADTSAVGAEVTTDSHHNPCGVYAALTGLAASALTWLDLLAVQLDAEADESSF